MRLKKIIRHLIGYLVGIGLFLVLIPYGIRRLALLDYPPLNIPVIPLDMARYILTGALLFMGLVFVVWSNIFLLCKGKGGPTEIGGLSVSPPTQALVVTGPYRHTRNPMVFGVFTIYLAITVYLNDLACLVLLILVFRFGVRNYLAIEERRLLNEFGDAYRSYKASTPMVVPFMGKSEANA